MERGLVLERVTFIRRRSVLPRRRRPDSGYGSLWTTRLFGYAAVSREQTQMWSAVMPVSGCTADWLVREATRGIFATQRNFALGVGAGRARAAHKVGANIEGLSVSTGLWVRGWRDAREPDQWTVRQAGHPEAAQITAFVAAQSEGIVSAPDQD
jgi:hypothetical protein